MRQIRESSESTSRGTSGRNSLSRPDSSMLSEMLLSLWMQMGNTPSSVSLSSSVHGRSDMISSTTSDLRYDEHPGGKKLHQPRSTRCSMPYQSSSSNHGQLTIVSSIAVLWMHISDSQRRIVCIADLWIGSDSRRRPLYSMPRLVLMEKQVIHIRCYSVLHFTH